MEEFFHLRLGHRPSTIRYYATPGSARTFDRRIEDEAFGSGAAALVPYTALRELAETHSPGDIARHFKVSVDLIFFRAKVTKCYRLLKSRRYSSPR
jgi:hypothetical protein